MAAMQVSEFDPAAPELQSSPVSPLPRARSTPSGRHSWCSCSHARRAVSLGSRWLRSCQQQGCADDVSGLHRVSRHPVARHVRWLHREIDAPPALSDLRFNEQDVRDGDIDYHLPGSGASRTTSTSGPPNRIACTTRMATTLLNSTFDVCGAFKAPSRPSTWVDVKQQSCAAPTLSMCSARRGPPHPKGRAMTCPMGQGGDAVRLKESALCRQSDGLRAIGGAQLREEGGHMELDRPVDDPSAVSIHYRGYRHLRFPLYGLQSSPTAKGSVSSSVKM